MCGSRAAGGERHRFLHPRLHFSAFGVCYCRRSFSMLPSLSSHGIMPPPLPLHVDPLQKLPPKRDDRFPPWSFPETVDLISIRSDLEKEFSHSKRNKSLWEIVSGRMKELGYRRSAVQCKCKWKNLVNRYKTAVTSQGKDTAELDSGRDCPYFEKLHAIFTERAKNMDRLLLEPESRGRPKQKTRKGSLADRSSEDLSDEEEDEDEESEDERAAKSKKRKSERERQRASAEKCRANSMREVLGEFFQQQQLIEVQWREGMEKRERERRAREEEFRSAMENLEKERILKEQQWQEREEQRLGREEVRAEKRDALFRAILNRLAGEL